MAFRTNKTPVLQEKTASGSVASFNTILQKPLVNGEFTIQAYQEGTGDPSPVNVRNIVPRREVNIVNMDDITNKVYFDGLLNGTYGFVDLGSLTWFKTSNFFRAETTLPLIQGTNSIISKDYTLANPYAITDDKVYLAFAQAATTMIIIIRDLDYSDANEFKNAMNGVYLIYELATPTTPTITKAQFEMLLNAFGINGELYTVALGEDVYGGSYNSVTGDKRKTFAKYTVTGNETFAPTANGQYIMQTPNLTTLGAKEFARTELSSAMCEFAPIKTYNSLNVSGEQTGLGIANFLIIGNVQYDNWSDCIGKSFIYELAEPIEVQLTPEEIQTFDGANNIFCDTGDTSVVFNDLDIAKRGSFREVFKLP